MSAVRNDERYKLFLERMPVNKYNVTKSALEAGFSRSVAESQQKRIMAMALKYQLSVVGIQVKGNLPTVLADQKKTMAELVGFSREEVMNNLKFLGTQDKDMGVRLRVIAPLAREYGVDLTPEEKGVSIVPTLHITVEKPSDNGST